MTQLLMTCSPLHVSHCTLLTQCWVLLGCQAQLHLML